MAKIKEEMKKMWVGEKTKPLATLMIYTIVIIMLFVVYLAAGKGTFDFNNKTNDNTIKDETTTTTDLDKLKSELLKNNFEYNYEIKKGTEIIIYNGLSTLNITQGIKENKNGNFKYYIKNNSIYEIKLNLLYPYTDLYTDVDYNLINPENIFSLIANQKAVSATEDSENSNISIYQFTINYKTLPLTITISVINDEQTEIKITQEGLEYNLTFNKIGKIETSQISDYQMAPQS